MTDNPGLDEAVHEVSEATRRTTSFGEMGPVGQGLVAVAWGLVSIAHALHEDKKRV